MREQACRVQWAFASSHRAWLLEKMFSLDLVADRDSPFVPISPFFFFSFIVLSRKISGEKTSEEQFLHNGLFRPVQSADNPALGNPWIVGGEMTKWAPKNGAHESAQHFTPNFKITLRKAM